MDYATPEVATKGWKVIDKNLEELGEYHLKSELLQRIERVKQGERDIYF